MKTIRTATACALPLSTNAAAARAYLVRRVGYQRIHLGQ